ncbi:MAG: hypothetical protein J7639_27170 [Paenibacillaceae bacterium]|nr:hypothetical protein [Paenibacillaceae bacterium]
MRVIDAAIRSKKMTDKLLQEMREVPKKHEMQLGMQGAGLEPGVLDILEYFKGRYLIALVTNNSVKAAEVALRDNNIKPYFGAPR